MFVHLGANSSFWLARLLDSSDMTAAIIVFQKYEDVVVLIRGIKNGSIQTEKPNWQSLFTLKV